jgi:hypothetical protein
VTGGLDGFGELGATWELELPIGTFGEKITADFGPGIDDVDRSLGSTCCGVGGGTLVAVKVTLAGFGSSPISVDKSNAGAVMNPGAYDFGPGNTTSGGAVGNSDGSQTL